MPDRRLLVASDGSELAALRRRYVRGAMPTKRRRRSITETPAVRAALDELRRELGSDRVELGELVVLGANVKLEIVRAERDRGAHERTQLADRVRERRAGADLAAADEVRAAGWARR
jgi:hypothetical protein